MLSLSRRSAQFAQANVCMAPVYSAAGMRQVTVTGEADLGARVLAYDETPRAARWMGAHAAMWYGIAAPPCDRLVVGPHTLPNVDRHVVALDFRHLPGQRDTLDLVSQLLSKGLPVRCQIRDLETFLDKCMASDVTCRALILRASLCSLAGLYDHCERAAPAELLFRLVGVLHLHPSAGARWFKLRSEGAPCRKLWLAVLQELVVHLVAQIPALRGALCEGGSWDVFEEHTLRLMNAVRRVLYDSDGDIDMAEDEAERVTRVPALPPVVPGPVFYELLLKCTTRVWRRELTALADQIDFVDLQARLHRVYCAAHGVRGLVGRLRMYGLSPARLRDCENVLRQTHGSGHQERNLSQLEEPLRDLLHKSPYSFAALHQEIKVAEAFGRTSVHPLPWHTTQAHIAALSVHGLLPITDCRVGNLVLCTSCAAVLSSVCDSDLRVYMSSTRAVMDTESRMLVCSKGHPNRSTVHRAERQQTETRSTKSSSPAHLFDVSSRSQRCKSTPLMMVPLLGNLVVHDGVGYSLCPVCGCAMRVVDYVGAPCMACRCVVANDACGTCDLCGVPRKELRPRFVWSASADTVVELRKLCTSCSVLKLSKDLVPEWVELKRKFQAHECSKQTHVLRGSCQRARPDRSSGS